MLIIISIWYIYIYIYIFFFFLIQTSDGLYTCSKINFMCKKRMKYTGDNVWKQSCIFIPSEKENNLKVWCQNYGLTNVERSSILTCIYSI